MVFVLIRAFGKYYIIYVRYFMKKAPNVTILLIQKTSLLTLSSARIVTYTIKKEAQIMRMILSSRRLLSQDKLILINMILVSVIEI